MILKLGAWAVMLAAILGFALIAAERAGWLPDGANHSHAAMAAMSVFGLVVVALCVQARTLAFALVSAFDRDGGRDA
ncbi:hypothetical protein [Burkholderia sp. TSV86]|uniref:hypothetical protein n=1 Tax=Burkholderia sp. TSV86 TaxID=1385594 RepID=UPI0007584A35|nr:hypothetical protein [Burkholderia sp. TSV86]KVE37273.1 hypothetical protein WS68_03400 [Burkholderia sp. TSV86]